MFARQSSGMEWFSRSEWGAAREHIAAIARRLSGWIGQLVVVGTVIAGVGWVGSAALTRTVVESTASINAGGGPVQVVESIAFSPCGKFLVSCGCDNLVRVWEVNRLIDDPSLEPAVFLAHASERHAVAFSADGALLGVAGNGSVAIWSCKSGQYKALLERDTETSRCLAFSPDGRTLALGLDDGTIRLWDIPDGHERAVILAHDSIVRSIAFSADSQRLVSSGQDAKIVLSDAVNGVCIRPLEVEPAALNPVLFVAFSPDGHTVAVGEVGVDPVAVRLLDSGSGKTAMRFAGHKAGVHALAFSPDGRTLATAGIDFCIKLWDVSTGKELIALPTGDTLVKAIAFSRDGARIAFGAGKNMVRIWEVGHQTSLSSVVLTDEGRL